jgi:hypothetical protein
MFASHCGYLTSLINPASNNLCTLFLWHRMRVDLQLVLDYLSANPYWIRGGPHENVAILLKELQELRLLL